MALLVIDTATEVLAAGLSDLLPAREMNGTPSGGELDGYQSLLESGPSVTEGGLSPIPLLGSYAGRVARGHSRLLQPAISHLFEQAGRKPGDLTAIGVGVGPGSYTGVRLGVSTAKAMGFALKIPVYPLSTLAAMAAAAVPGVHSGSARVLSLLYARRGRAFGALYEKRLGRWELLVQPAVLPLSDWARTMAEVRTGTLRHGNESTGVKASRNGAVEGGLTETVVHDFRPQHQLQSAVEALGMEAEVPLWSCAGNLAQGLADIWTLGDGPKLEGESLHSLKPTYALEVEAEVKLKEGMTDGRTEKRQSR